jgi:caffeoyl-CoA O-methyltransferase
MSDLVDNPEEYFSQLVPPRDDLLTELEQEALQEEIPIIGPVVGELLNLLARVTRSEKILELGTATGYSGIYLARALTHSNGRLVTIDNDAQKASRAEANFKRAGVDQLVEIIVGEALEVLAKMDEQFDLIFLDVEKAFYAGALPHCRRLLKRGGLFVADNVGFKDAEPFNRLISESQEWRSVHLFAFLPQHSPEKDGLCLAIRL